MRRMRVRPSGRAVSAFWGVFLFALGIAVGLCLAVLLMEVRRAWDARPPARRRATWRG